MILSCTIACASCVSPDVLTSIANPIKGKLERNETVIKILKQFNLAPEHPPADFSGVYIYALVEYGIAFLLLQFPSLEEVGDLPA